MMKHSHQGRAAAARLLLTARGARLSKAAEAMDWALQLIPDSQPAIRMRARLYMLDEDYESARTLIARGLLARPNDLLLRLLRAECELVRGDLLAAEREATAVLSARPHRADAIELAAQIAMKCGEHAKALGLLERCLARRPGDERVTALLIESLLALGEAENLNQAEELLSCMHDAPPLLIARIFLRQSRLRDALEYLEAHIAAEHPSPSDSLLTEYLRILERCGEMARIDAVADCIDAERHPDATLYLARIMLARGRFRAARARSIALMRRRLRIEESLIVFASACACGGRALSASRAVKRLSKVEHGTDGQNALAFRADCWRRGLLGRAIAQQMHIEPPAHRRQTSVLQPLLKSAVSVFEAKWQQCRDTGNHEVAQHESDLALCRGALNS